ncbi:MAG TPA: OPT/YSL family transporter, partial [Kofleriaceae bacterium]|nr:OPT/YSL family transporter [Kofleriaceae bacterium]
LGFGPNVSVVAAFFGYLFLGILFRNFTRWENNIVQTAGTSAAQTAFMCVILAAFDLLAQTPGQDYTFAPSVVESFLWLTFAGILGILLAVPLRRHYVEEEALTYADGVAAAETIIVLDARGKEARRAALALFVAAAVSAAVWFLTTKWGGRLLDVPLDAEGKQPGVLPEVLLATMGGLTALFLKWRTLARTFSTMSSKAVQSGDLPMRWIALGVAGASVALVILEYVFFGLPIWMTLIAIAISVPLMLVGLRVLGETNWGPISQLTNMMQALFAALMPGKLTANLAASGTTGTIATQSEAIMQDYKAGHILGSTPRYLTYSQLLAAPIGALAVALVNPQLRDLYGVGGEGLASPISIRIAGFADILSKGFDALPAYALTFLVIGAAVGILIALGEAFVPGGKTWLPSATGLGIGMMVPGAVVFVMVLGGILMALWRRLHTPSADQLGMPLASGLIAGEAIMAIVIPALIAMKLIAP